MHIKVITSLPVGATPAELAKLFSHAHAAFVGCEVVFEEPGVTSLDGIDSDASRVVLDSPAPNDTTAEALATAEAEIASLSEALANADAEVARLTEALAAAETAKAGSTTNEGDQA